MSDPHTDEDPSTVTLSMPGSTTTNLAEDATRSDNGGSQKLNAVTIKENEGIVSGDDGPHHANMTVNDNAMELDSHYFDDSIPIVQQPYSGRPIKL